MWGKEAEQRSGGLGGSGPHRGHPGLPALSAAESPEWGWPYHSGCSPGGAIGPRHILQDLRASHPRAGGAAARWGREGAQGEAGCAFHLTQRNPRPKVRAAQGQLSPDLSSHVPGLACGWSLATEGAPAAVQCGGPEPPCLSHDEAGPAGQGAWWERLPGQGSPPQARVGGTGAPRLRL